MLKRSKFLNFFVLFSLSLIVAVAMIGVSTSKSSAASLSKPKISVAAYNGKIKVSIKKVKRAKKYQIYRASKKTGKYKKVKTTSKRTWFDKKAKGTKYYKVRAIRGRKKSSFSKVKRAYGGVSAYIAGARGQTTFGAGPVTTVMVRIKNNTNKTIYVLGNTKDGRKYTLYRYLIYKMKNRKPSKKVAPQSSSHKAWLSVADGGFDVYCNVIKPKKTRYVYMSFTDLRAVYTGWSYYSEFVNKRSAYYTAVYPYFSTTKPRKNNPLSTSGKYMLGASTLGWSDGYVKAK